MDRLARRSPPTESPAPPRDDPAHPALPFRPDPAQALVLAHDRGPLLLTGGAGSGKTAVLRERLALLVEEGADPERVVLVVRSRRERAEARRSLLERLRRPLPGLHATTIHGAAHRVLASRYAGLDYDRPPRVLTAVEQFSRVQELLRGEDPADWPAYGGMLRLRGFADEVRQFLLRAQEALLTPEEILRRAERSGLTGWRELASFYRRYLDVLADEGSVDFAGLVVQAAASAGAGGQSMFDHVLVDDYQDSSFAAERLLVELRPTTLVVAGDPNAHVFSFQGSTDVPLARFRRVMPSAGHVELPTRHRGPGPGFAAWFTSHSSEEHAAAARELRRIHHEEGVAWRDLAVVARRQGAHLAGMLRALDDAGIPRVAPEAGVSLLAEPATFPFVLALRWAAGVPAERDALVEPLLTSDLLRLSPGVARGLVRAAAAAGRRPSAALEHDGALLGEQGRRQLEALRGALAEAEAVAEASVLEAFAALWRRLPYARRLVEEADTRALDAVLTLSDAVSRAAEGADPSVTSFLRDLTDGGDGPGHRAPEGSRRPDAVSVLTAHGTAGREFDTVLVLGAEEGDFPSLARPEPMFDLLVLDRRPSQAERNRSRLEDERRLFRMVVGRARRRALFLASEPHGDDHGASSRSRFVPELGVTWQPGPMGPFEAPLSRAEAVAAWRRRVADARSPRPERLASLEGLIALGEDASRWWHHRDWTDTGRPLHEQLRVSYSRLDKLDNCALQFVLAEELGLERRAGFHAWVGNLVHRLIEECEAGMLDRSLEALLSAVEARWEPERFPSRAVSEAFRRLVTRTMVPGWFEEYGSSPALGREVRFEFPFEGATVAGYIDRIAAVQGGGSQITDYKTGKARNAGKADENLQLGIYYLAVHHAEELAAYRPVKQIELAFLRDRRDGRIARAAKGFSAREQGEYRERMRERLRDLVLRLAELQRTENYPPSAAASCRLCEFKPLCPLWPEGQEVLPVEASW